MTHTQTVLRIAAQQRTNWNPEDRERTIYGFLDEVCQALTPEVLEYLAEHDPDKLKSMFFDWAGFRKKRDRDQRVSLLIASVAKVATPVPFALADGLGNPDLSTDAEPARGNVVSLVSAR